jgi:ceramide glucosyltransferase
LRAAVAIKVGVGVVHDRAVWQHLWLVPIRDLVAFAVWFASFADHTVHWRGEVFILENGKIRPAHPRESERVSAAKTDRDKVSVHS